MFVKGDHSEKVKLKLFWDRGRPARPYHKFNSRCLSISYAGGRDARGPREELEFYLRETRSRFRYLSWRSRFSSLRHMRGPNLRHQFLKMLVASHSRPVWITLKAEQVFVAERNG